MAANNRRRLALPGEAGSLRFRLIVAKALSVAFVLALVITVPTVRIDSKSLDTVHEVRPIQFGDSAGSGHQTSVLLDDTPPTSSDLSFNNDTQPVRALQALAANLSNNPLKLFLFVRNSVYFDPYAGSMKGAYQTFSTMAGNDVDQASLLISLLRISHVPTRYVVGEIDVPIASVLNWLGFSAPANVTITMGDQAATILSEAGISYSWGYISEGVAASIHFKIAHVWVEAYLNGSWVEMDPSFKQYSYFGPVDASDVFNQFSAKSLAFLNTSNDDYYSSYVSSAFANYLQYNPNLDLGNITASAVIQNVTGYTVADNATVKSTGPSLPASDDWQLKVTFPTYDPSTGQFSESPGHATVLPTSILGDSPLTVFSWANNTTLEYVHSLSGGIFNASANVRAIDMTPVLSFNGTVLLVGDSIPLGLQMPIYVESILNTTAVASGTPHLTMGGSGAIDVTLGHDMSPFDDEVEEELGNYSGTVSEYVRGQKIGVAPLIGDQFAVVGASYFGAVDAASLPAERYLDIVSVSLVGVAFVSAQVNLLYNDANLPIRAVFGGEVIDVQINPHYPGVQLEGNLSLEDSFNLYSSGLGSYLEGATIASSFATAPISTVSIFQYAHQHGIPIMVMSPANFSRVYPGLGLPSWVLPELQPFIDEGDWVAIPDQPVSPTPLGLQASNVTSSPGVLSTWVGIAFMVIDPTNLGAGYYISGQLTAAQGSSEIGTTQGGAGGTNGTDDAALIDELDLVDEGCTNTDLCFLQGTMNPTIPVDLYNRQSSAAMTDLLATALSILGAAATVSSIFSTVSAAAYWSAWMGATFGNDALVVYGLSVWGFLAAPVELPVLGTIIAGLAGATLLYGTYECIESASCYSVLNDLRERFAPFPWNAPPPPFLGPVADARVAALDPSAQLGLYLRNQLGPASGFGQETLPDLQFTDHYSGDNSNPQQLDLYDVPAGVYDLSIVNDGNSPSVSYGWVEWTSELATNSTTFSTPTIPAGATESASLKVDYSGDQTNVSLGAFLPASFLNLTTSPSVVLGTANIVHGFLEGPNGASPLAGQQVELWYRPVSELAGSWTSLGSATTLSNGTFSWPWTPTMIGTLALKATFAGNSSFYPAATQSLVIVRAYLEVAAHSVALEPVVRLNVSVTGPGYTLFGETNSSGEAMFLLDNGTYVLDVATTLPAGTGVRWAFERWGDGVGSANRTLEFSNDMLLNASYVLEDQVSVRSSLNGIPLLVSNPTLSYFQGGIQSSAQIRPTTSTVWVDAGSTVTAVAKPDLFLAFQAWIINGTSVSSSLTYQFNVSAPIQLTAKFATPLSVELGFAAASILVVAVLILYAATRSRRKGSQPPQSGPTAPVVPP
jgi:hypothetical protein